MARRLGEALARRDARAPADLSGDADADAGGEVRGRRRDGAVRTFGGDSDDASSGSDLDSDDDDDDDDDDEGAAARETPNGGGGEGDAGFAGFTDRDGPGVGPGVGPGDGPGDGRPREAPGGPEIVVVDDDDDAPRRAGIRSADFAPRAVRPRDDDVVPDSQSDEDDADGRGTRRGFGGGGGGGGDREEMSAAQESPARRAVRPSVPPPPPPPRRRGPPAPGRLRAVRSVGPRSAGGALAAERRIAGRRLRRRRAARVAPRRPRRRARASVLEHELASETRAAASENEAARALREASACDTFPRSSRDRRDEDEDAAYRFSSRLVDRAADALAAAEAASSARAARAFLGMQSRRAEGSHAGDLATNASSDDARESASAARAECEVDEILASTCALATLLSRRACSVTSAGERTFSCGTARAARRALERLVHGDAGSDDVFSETNGSVPRNDASAFRARSGVRRAVTLRAVLRSLEHARAASAHIAAANLVAGELSGALSAASNDAKDFVAATVSVATSLLAVLGEEFCLLREHARWRARRQGGESATEANEPFRENENVAPPPPLPPALAAFVGEDVGPSADRRVEENATAATADASAAETQSDGTPSSFGENAMDAAERLLTRMEECHVLLTFALRALRRVASASTVRVLSNDVVSGYGQTGTAPRHRDVVFVAPGSDALLSETLAAFLRPRYPFRARLRKRALAVVASHATATRRCFSLFSDAEASAFGSRAATEALRASAAALDSTVWPALASLLESDHPARRDATKPNANVTESFQRDLESSGCGRFVIEASARVMACLLASRVWSWGRAEREIVAPHTNASEFWRKASAPYRALALRLYSRLCDCDASPVLSAGAGAPLLKLWTLATLDPAAAEGLTRSGSGSGSAGGFGRARARLARAVRRHPSLGARFFVDEDALTSRDETDAFGVVKKKYSLYSPAPVPLETRGKWVRDVLARLCAERDVSVAAGSNALAALAAANAAWDAAPARHAEVFGTTAADRFADAVADVSAAAVSFFAAKLHATHPGPETKSFHVAGAHVCVASCSHGPRSRNASRLTAMTHVIAARHAHVTAAASSARSVASSALAAAAYAGSGRAEAAAKTAERAERLVLESTRRVRDATIGLRALFARRGHDAARNSAPTDDRVPAKTYAPQDDPPLVGAVVALTHALWERGPPRAPTEEARDAAADAFFDDAFASLSRGGCGRGHDDDDGSASLASFALSAIFRGALARCVPNRVLLDDASHASLNTHTRGGGGGAGFLMNGATHGGHMYPPGAVAAALGTIRAASRLLTRAELNGSLPETVAGSFCVLASALLDAARPPPPPRTRGGRRPPRARRRRRRRCGARRTRTSPSSPRAPGACGETDREDEDLSRDFGKREHLRAFCNRRRRRVVEGACARRCARR